jgi:hypothetical protein
MLLVFFRSNQITAAKAFSDRLYAWMGGGGGGGWGLQNRVRRLSPQQLVYQKQPVYNYVCVYRHFVPVLRDFSRTFLQKFVRKLSEIQYKRGN